MADTLWTNVKEAILAGNIFASRDATSRDVFFMAATEQGRSIVDELIRSATGYKSATPLDVVYNERGNHGAQLRALARQVSIPVRDRTQITTP